MNINTITVYLGSSGYCRDIFKDSAKELGEAIAKAGKHLVYGGMDTGLMGIIARTAQEGGADVTGIIPMKLKDSERILHGLTETILVDELWDRKKRMFQMADATITLPGGFGTVDEAVEVLYWGALHLHSKPVVIVNIDGYWDDLIAYIRSLPDFNPQYLLVIDSVDAIFSTLDKWQAPEIIPSTKADKRFPHFEDEICRRTNEPIMLTEATIENTYYGICALGLRQLGKHDRGIGFLNTDGQFDRLKNWIKSAGIERFVTPKCLKLFAIEENEATLRQALKDNAGHIEIDLHRDKWGD
ncbi:MAG: TIGR00730 family Rossman fold protein [Micavibrio sp.]|nr:TIGR00730 family Rossman fold protein [Micavibrio sp.]